MQRWLPLLFLVISGLGLSRAYALGSEAATEQVKVQLLASVTAVQPGAEFWVGIRQQIIPHWHTYWQNPGDSGLSTSVAFTLPQGATVSNIQWPTPEKIVTGPVTNFGYSDDVTLLSKISVPKSAALDDAFLIKAYVKWLVCEEICLPQEAELTLTLPTSLAETGNSEAIQWLENAKAQLPVENPWEVSLERKQTQLKLTVFNYGNASAIKAVNFFPSEWGHVAHGAEQSWRVDGETIELLLEPGEAPLSQGELLTGVLAITEDKGSGTVKHGLSIKVAEASVPADNSSTQISAPDQIHVSTALFLALAGGLILNLMPCVFPVLSLKALAFVKHSDQDQHEIRINGWLYTLGILASFTLLSGLLYVLKASGAQIGWGFQFQSPIFVICVAYLMFAVGLSLAGVFSIGSSVMGVGSALANRAGYLGSFFTGALATVVATPCTAPFMGVALGFALTQPAVIFFAVFLSLGFGLALPFLVLSHWPALQRFLPKPGVWMERFKQGLAFPMFATCVWLLWVLSRQIGINGTIIALSGMVIIALSAWLFELSKSLSNPGQLGGITLASSLLGIVLLGSFYGVSTHSDAATFTENNSGDTEVYTASRFSELRKQGKPVFLNMTASWCISCLVNEKVALNQQSVVEFFKQSGITYLKGDWTNGDKEVTKLLTEFGRSGVPLYVFYPAGLDGSVKPLILPQILTPEIITQSLAAALIVGASG